jgi:iron-sulfur cluster assembly protein
MTITLSDAAARQIGSQLARRGTGLGLRVVVKSSGCSGYAYDYEIADELRAGDRVFEAAGAKLVVDAQSLAFIDGARLDFVTQGLKQSFAFDNPNAAGTCGCGESFNMKGAPA